MTAILVILTFAVFLTIDYLLSRHEQVEQEQPEALPVASAEPVWVAGYELPSDLYFHPGHTWVRPLGREMATVGIDDFARRLLGRIERVELPSPGRELRQGEPALRIYLDGRTVELVSPVDGEVEEVNAGLRTRPDRLETEPYGRGWLLRIRSRSLGRSLRNLLGGSLAHRWPEDARQRLELRLVALSGSVLQDGGEPVADFVRHLPYSEWRRLVREFLLTE